MPGRITRHREPLDPSIDSAAEGSQELPPPRGMIVGAAAEPNRRRGNQNARTHGIYAAEPGDPEEARMRILRDINLAIKRSDHRAMMRHARALAHLGDREFAAVVRAHARTIHDQQQRADGRRGFPIRRNAHGSPERITRAWQSDRERERDRREEGAAE